MALLLRGEAGRLLRDTVVRLRKIAEFGKIVSSKLRGGVVGVRPVGRRVAVRRGYGRVALLGLRVHGLIAVEGWYLLPIALVVVTGLPLVPDLHTAGFETLLFYNTLRVSRIRVLSLLSLGLVPPALVHYFDRKVEVNGQPFLSAEALVVLINLAEQLFHELLRVLKHFPVFRTYAQVHWFLRFVFLRALEMAGTLSSEAEFDEVEAFPQVGELLLALSDDFLHLVAL